MASAVWIDGAIYNKLQAAISPFDHGLLFGDGVKCGLRLVDSNPIRLTHHYNLLIETAQNIALKLPFTLALLQEAIYETSQTSQRRDGYIQIMVTRGAGMLGPDPRKCEPRAIVLLDDLLPYPPELRVTGIHAIMAKHITRRANHASDRGLLLADPVATEAMREALGHGCFEAIVRNAAGHATGTSSGALFAVRAGRLLTPPEAYSPDPVAQRAVKTIAIATGFLIDELHEIEPDDQLFFAGSGFGIIGINLLDGVPRIISEVVSEFDKQFQASTG